MSTRRLLEVEYSSEEGVVIHLRPRMIRLVPKESRQHWRNANKECLLAMRSLLDTVIERMTPTTPEEQRQGRRRQRVEVKEEKA